MLRNFQTSNESFTGDYSRKAHHQAKFNEGIIDSMSDYISKWFASSSKPISILDLCCGHGKPTYDLLIKLLEKGVTVELITGYDISPAQIEQAITNYGHEPKLSFHVQNAENMNDVNKYDVAVSLFGLHWMDNIGQVASLIFTSLKPGGKLMFFVPLEKVDLFEFREKFLQTSKYTVFFEDYTIHPFISEGKEYIAAFDKYFITDYQNTTPGTRELKYTEEELITFLSSWMQEVRHLKAKSIECSNYVKELIDTIPVDHKGNIQKIDEGHSLFIEHFFSYQGEARLAKEITEYDGKETEVLGGVNDSGAWFATL